ncbi:hypothetical protein [Blastococcus tunisiensis]|nr:hypothetical protein [Blastococcus sp. DSM 46838]
MMPLSHRLLLVTANAVVVAAAGIRAPLGWMLVPILLAVSTTPAVAAVVAAWSAVLIALSIAVPVVPGHQSDPLWLAVSGLSLASLPVFARLHRRRMAAEVTPNIRRLTPEGAPRPAVLALSRAEAEVAASTKVRGLGTRVLLGVVQGKTAGPARVAWTLEQAFEAIAARRTASLAEIAGALDQLVEGMGPDVHVAASLVEISASGQVWFLRCGGPAVLAARQVVGTGAVVGEGPGGLPLGLGAPAGEELVEAPAGARLAVVTHAFSAEHYDDYVGQVQESLAARTPELAAIRLMLGHATGASAPVVGPALVIEPVTD